MSRHHIEPGCLAYVKHTSTNEPARGRVVIVVRPWRDGDVIEIGEARFSEPKDADVWWIRAVREGETLPVMCSASQHNCVRSSQLPLSIERAAHLRRIDGPGLVSDADIMRERARDMMSQASNHIFRDIRELDRALGRVALSKLITPSFRGPL